MMEFYLVQRLKRSPWAEHKAFYERPGVKVKSNPFSYGRMGDYELDYMGAAEFEFGTIPDANNRLAKAGKDIKLSIGEHEYKGRKLDFLYIGSGGDPFPKWKEWADNGFYGKERPFDFEQKLTEPDYEHGGDVWWALEENVMWAFHDEGHLLKLIESMSDGPTEFLR